MAPSGQHWSDYYFLKAGEPERVLNTVFELDKGSKAVYTPAKPFECAKGSYGQGGAYLRATSFTCISAVETISARLGNASLIYGSATVSVRDCFYYNQTQLFQELDRVCGSDQLFSTDHLGYVQYAGDESIRIPAFDPDGFELVDSLAHKLGFQGNSVVEMSDKSYYLIEPRDTAERLGDMFGPLSEIIVVNEELQPSVTENVLAVVPLMTRSPRGVSSFSLSSFGVKPLSEYCLYPKFTFQVLDKLGRQVHFLVNRPSLQFNLGPL